MKDIAEDHEFNLYYHNQVHTQRIQSATGNYSNEGDDPKFEDFYVKTATDLEEIEETKNVNIDESAINHFLKVDALGEFYHL